MLKTIGRGNRMPDGPENPQELVEIPLVLTGQHEVPIFFSNWASVQHEKSEFVITFGQYTPPLIVGSTEQQRDQARATVAVPVKVVARIALTHQRMVELGAALQQNLQNYERRKGIDEKE